MGMPRSTQTKKGSKFSDIGLRMTPPQVKIVKEAVEIDGGSRNAFCVRAVLAAARGVIAQRAALPSPPVPGKVR